MKLICLCKTALVAMGALLHGLGFLVVGGGMVPDVSVAELEQVAAARFLVLIGLVAVVLLIDDARGDRG